MAPLALALALVAHLLLLVASPASSSSVQPGDGGAQLLAQLRRGDVAMMRPQGGA